MDLTPYLFFNGRCEEAIDFYGKALGAKDSLLMRAKDSPVPPPASSTESHSRPTRASLRS